MLTRSIFVRRLIPGDTEAHAKDPEGYAGAWVSNPDGEIGEAVSVTWMPVAADPANPNNVSMVPMLGVCWFETKSPAISWESPAFLENVDEEMSQDEDEEEEEEEEEEPASA